MKEKRLKMRSIVIMLAIGAVAGCGDSGKNHDAPAKANPEAAPATSPPRTPLVTKKQVADWCVEHGVPESICTRCNESLIEGYKAKADWCQEHGLPESQCFTCHPDLEAKFKALAPKADEKK